MSPDHHPQLGENWTSAAAAVEGILAWLGEPLPRFAIMGLTGHAWHTCVQTKGEVTALPAGPHDLDWEAMVRRYARTGYRWERFGALLAPENDPAVAREAAIAWAGSHLAAGRPLAGFDFHLHEFGIVYAIDRERGGFLVESLLTQEVGPLALFADWPSAVGQIELFAPVEQVEPDPDDLVFGALETALEVLEGRDAPDDGQPRGTAGLDTWAEVLDGEGEVDRAGNAYTLAVLQAARQDGAAFLEHLAAAIPDLAASLNRAARAARDEAQALAPLITLFPFPTGGHGNVNNPGLRRGAAMALRRAAAHERTIAAAIQEALNLGT